MSDPGQDLAQKMVVGAACVRLAMVLVLLAGAGVILPGWAMLVACGLGMFHILSAVGAVMDRESVAREYRRRNGWTDA